MYYTIGSQNDPEIKKIAEDVIGVKQPKKIVGSLTEEEAAERDKTREPVAQSSKSRYYDKPRFGIPDIDDMDHTLLP